MSEYRARLEDCLVSWRELLRAVTAHTVGAPVDGLAEGDADVLQQAANNIRIRLHEERERWARATPKGAGARAAAAP